MRLTIEDDPQAIRRYAHVRPTGRGPRCGVRLSGTDRVCSLEPSHRGPHVAHGRFRRVVAVWQAVTPARPSSEARSRVVEARVQAGLPRRGSPSLPARLAAPIRRLSVEDVVLFILFAAFLGFAVDWFLRILG